MIPTQKHWVRTQSSREVYFPNFQTYIICWTSANMVPGGYSYKYNSLIFFTQCFFLNNKIITFQKRLYPQDTDVLPNW